MDPSQASQSLFDEFTFDSLDNLDGTLITDEDISAINDPVFPVFDEAPLDENVSTLDDLAVAIDPALPADLHLPYDPNVAAMAESLNLFTDAPEAASVPFHDALAVPQMSSGDAFEYDPMMAPIADDLLGAFDAGQADSLFYPVETPYFAMPQPQRPLAAFSPDALLYEQDNAALSSLNALQNAFPSAAPFEGAYAGAFEPSMPGSYEAPAPKKASVVSISSDSSTQSLVLEPQRFAVQKPRVDREKHPWVRANVHAKGSERSGKINEFDPEKVYKPIQAPSSWRAHNGTKFTYNTTGELRALTMSANDLAAFIYENPHDIKLRIQRSPADSARRYPTSTLSKCRFAECPARGDRMPGSILAGHYRVALDETHDQRRVDPFHVAAYVHLYCLERFLDLADVAAKRVVEADVRQIDQEPKGRFAAAMQRGPDGDARVVDDFLRAVRANKVRGPASSWAQYPAHSVWDEGEGKDFKQTVCYKMHQVKESRRCPSQVGQFEKRGLKKSNILWHMGDLELFMEGKRGIRAEARKRRRNDDTEVEADEDDEESPSKKARTSSRLQKRKRDEPSRSDSDASSGSSHRLRKRARSSK